MNNSEIYQKLISIKPFFEKTEKISESQNEPQSDSQEPQEPEEHFESQNDSEKIIHTYKTVKLVQGRGNVFYNANDPVIGGTESYVTLLEIDF